MVHFPPLRGLADQLSPLAAQVSKYTMADKSSVLFVPASLPPQLERGRMREDSWKNEMNSFAGGRAVSEADAEWLEEDHLQLLHNEERREGTYGSTTEDFPEEEPAPLRERLSQNRSRRKIKRHYPRLDASPFTSLRRVRSYTKPSCILCTLD